MNEANEHIDDLIGKLLSGEASIQERDEVESWVASTPESRHYFEQVKSIFERAKTMPATENFDVDAAWLKVSKKIKPRARVIAMMPSAKSVLSWRIAATIIVLIGISALIYQMFAERSVSFTYQSTDVILKDTLADGTMATLNKRSSLTFEYNEKEKIRKAKLKGEAFFEVVHDESRSFVIETQDVFIRDIGTAFNVRSEETSDSIVVFVKEGEVSFYSEKDNGIKLIAGDEGVYVKSTKTFSKSHSEDQNESSYADKQFRFRNTSMKRVLKKIREVYGDKLELSNPELEECRITVNFDNDNIETIATVIAETMGWQVTEVSAGVYLLKGENCLE